MAVRRRAPMQGPVVYPAEGVSLPRSVAPGGFASGGGTVNKEDLGTQVIEGVVATGTRTTTTIAAGSIGNEQPILIVSEQWFSADLKVLVMTKHSDPRSGETSLSLDQHRPGRAGAVALRSAGRLHDQGCRHPASVSDGAARLARIECDVCGRGVTYSPPRPQRSPPPFSPPPPVRRLAPQCACQNRP